MRLFLAFANSFLAVLIFATLYSIAAISSSPTVPSVNSQVESFSLPPAQSSTLQNVIQNVGIEDELRYRITYFDDTEDREHTVEVSTFTTAQVGEVTPDTDLPCHIEIRNSHEWQLLPLQAVISMENQGELLTRKERYKIANNIYFDHPYGLYTEHREGKTVTPFQINFVSGEPAICELYERQLVSFYNTEEDRVDTGYGRIKKIEFLYDTTDAVRKPPPPTPTVEEIRNIVYRVRYFTFKDWYGSQRVRTVSLDRIRFSGGVGENGETWGSGPFIEQIPCRDDTVPAAGLDVVRNTTKYDMSRDQILTALPNFGLGQSHKIEIENGATYTCTLDGLHTLKFGTTTLYWPQIEYIQFIKQR